MSDPLNESDSRGFSPGSSMRVPGSSHGSRPAVPAFLRNLQSRGGGGAGAPPGSAGGMMGFVTASSPANSGSLFDLLGDEDRVNSLDLVSEETLLKVKRGLWFIIRGQKIHTIDGVSEFLEEVKEEMARQQMRDETEAAGGTEKLIESMMVTSMRPSTADSTMSPMFSQSSTASSVASSNNDSFFGRPTRGPVRVAASSAVAPEEDHDHDPSPDEQQQQHQDDEQNASPLLPRPAASAAFLQAQQSATTAAAGGEGGGGKNKNNNSNEVPFAEREFGSEEQRAAELERLEKQAAMEGRLPPLVKARTVLEYAIETKDQKDQRAITNIIEAWTDPVSLLIVASQLFVLYSVGIHAGFNVPITVPQMVCDKLFGDLVALCCIIYRCVAPFKEHGMWHFDSSTRVSRYFTSGRMLIDVIGVFPLDLIGYGIGEHCAWTVPDRCALVGGHWQLNRLAQTWGMFDTVGVALESLFLRKGLHPILGRVAEVLLFLICLAHFCACAFNLLISRHLSVLGDFFGDEAADDPALLGEDKGFLNKTVAHQYFVVSDWAIKSLVGLSPRGTSFPDDGWDQAVVISITIIGVAVFTLWIATIKLYLDRDCPEKTLGQLVDETLDMVQYMHLDDDFRDECLDYFNHMFQARFHMTGMRDFEEDLAGGLARKMRFVVGRELVQHIPLLQSLQDNEPFIVSLMQRIEPLVLPPETVIFRRDELGSTMLVIIKGKVAVLNPSNEDKILTTLGPGKVVGEVALLMDTPRTATVVSCNAFVNVLSMDRKQMGELILLFPEIAPILMAQMAERMRGLASAKMKNVDAPQKAAASAVAAVAAAEAAVTNAAADATSFTK